MNLNLLYFLSLFIIISAHSILGQSLNLPIYAEKYTYKDPSQKRLLTEVYVSFAQSQIKNQDIYKNDTLDVIVEIYRNGNLSTRGWHLFPLNSFLKGNSSSVFLDNFAFALNSGENILKISVKNRNVDNKISGNLEEKVVIPDYSAKKPFMSDILISDLITKPTDLNSHFIKKGILVQPFPIRIFSPAKPLLYSYIEFYNLKKESVSEYSTSLEIVDESGNIAKKLKTPNINFLDNTGFIVSGQNIMSLKDGRYKIQASLLYKNEIKDKKTINIKVRKKKKIPVSVIQPQKMDPEYLTKSEGEIDDEIYVLKYIMKEQTWKNFRTMNLQNKKVILSKFWKQNDYKKETPENEFRIKYLNLVKYVREQFSDAKNDGVDTDMGRVILLYGKPDYINRNTDDDLAGQSVEVWQYNKYQAYFLFVQENFTGPYRMVHSTMKGETYDPFWLEYLKSNSELLNR